MDINEILQYLPHRYPFLLVDRVLQIEEGKRILAVKNVTINEPFFPGHFPGHPVMPGVLIVEAMAQVAALLSFKTMGVVPDENSVVLFAGIDNVRFKRQVVPGDQLVFDVEILQGKRNIYKYKGVARVNDQIATEAELMCALKAK
ncbi:3-hydroxyacyl-ACP dehydratase FabZ [Pseudothauera nasutitermitis]|uniref:3-hydroxyacyl-[acyl-carrier-protein] dehydratase FabZ n=1 Tax=Pseudothauera nasutitermitis TaxID=2565930 RepID=A0A4S4B125_9RHOO|nr:3-hydroxyacyl-ACP dehydratase FabZ [Pseudothauera nasutitermitis]THF66214.1 3-hydroxyacyl-ACP dehydratase FabZ [Pseudothauera nasutitermitis]